MSYSCMTRAYYTGRTLLSYTPSPDAARTAGPPPACAAGPPDTGSPSPCPAKPGGDGVVGSGRQDQPRGGHAGAGGDEHVLDVIDLVHRAAAYLPHALGDAVHAVDVGLAELTTVRVQG
jgi:hypothetical protein